MVWWIACAIVIIDLCLAVSLSPVRIVVDLQARGEPQGVWAAAGGLALGPLAASGAAARGVPATVQVHAFGRCWWTKRGRGQLDQGPEGESETGGIERARRALQRVGDGYRRFARWFDPLDLALFLVRERRRIRPHHLEVDLDYAFEDPMLTGRLLAAVYVLESVLPDSVVVRSNPSWELVDRAHLALRGELRVWPVLAAVDVIWYAITNVRVWPRHSAAS